MSAQPETLFVICPGFGHPHIEHKERILRNNLRLLKDAVPHLIYRVCIYSADYRLPDDLASSLEPVYQPGIVGQFLIEHAHPEELQARGVTHVAILLDDVELKPDVDLEQMQHVLSRGMAHIASPVLTLESAYSHEYMRHAPAYKPKTATLLNTCEMFFLFMSLQAYKTYYSGLDYRNPWCWGIDLTIGILRNQVAALFNDMHMVHWYKGSGAAGQANAAADMLKYLAVRNLDPPSVLRQLKRRRIVLE